MFTSRFPIQVTICSGIKIRYCPIPPFPQSLPSQLLLTSHLFTCVSMTLPYSPPHLFLLYPRFTVNHIICLVMFLHLLFIVRRDFLLPVTPHIAMGEHILGAFHPIIVVYIIPPLTTTLPFAHVFINRLALTNEVLNDTVS